MIAADNRAPGSRQSHVIVPDHMGFAKSETPPDPLPPHRLAARAAGRRLASASEAMLAGLYRHLTTRENLATREAA